MSAEPESARMPQRNWLLVAIALAGLLLTAGVLVSNVLSKVSVAPDEEAESRAARAGMAKAANRTASRDPADSGSEESPTGTRTERTGLKTEKTPERYTVELKILRSGTHEPVSGAEILQIPEKKQWFHKDEALRAERARDPDAFYRRYARVLHSDANGVVRLPLGRVWHRVLVFHGALYGEIVPDPYKPSPQVVYLATDYTLLIVALDFLGRPAVGVPIIARSRPQGSQEPEAPQELNLGKTDESGRLVLHHVQTRASDRTSFEVNIVAKLIGGCSDPAVANLAMPPANPIVLRLPPTGEVECRVLRPSGVSYTRQLDLEWLTAYVFDKQPTRQEAITGGLGKRVRLGPEGRSLLRHVLVGKYLAVSPSLKIMEPVLFRGPAEPGARVEVPIRLSFDPITIIGRAVGEGRRPLPGHELEVTLEFGSYEMRTKTDSNGRFKVHLPWCYEPVGRLAIHAHLEKAGVRCFSRGTDARTLSPGEYDFGDLVFREDPGLAPKRRTPR